MAWGSMGRFLAMLKMVLRPSVAATRGSVPWAHKSVSRIARAGGRSIFIHGDAAKRINVAQDQVVVLAFPKRSWSIQLAVIVGSLMIAEPALADGGSGNVVPTQVHVEGGSVYVIGTFSNPDRCVASTVAILAPANTDELARMMSMAMTASASGKKISLWFSGCGPTPWQSSAPRAVAMSFYGN